jgi:hypothetical protein
VYYVATAATTTTAIVRRQQDSSSWTIFQPMIPIVGSFCVWEVWMLAIVMIALLMPSFTNTILMNPQCQILDPTIGFCFTVDFEILPEYTYLLNGWKYVDFPLDDVNTLL